MKKINSIKTQYFFIMIILIFTFSFFVFSVRTAEAKIIKDDVTGYDCNGRDGNLGIGNWDASSKVCTLNKDVNETVQISSGNITLDGNSHKVTGANTGNGIYVNGSNVVIKNINVSGFTYGINIRKSGAVVSSSTITKNYYGIYVFGSSSNLLSVSLLNNIVSFNNIYGIGLSYTKNNNISKNIVGPSNQVGLVQFSSEKNYYESNDFFGNQNGVTLRGNYNTLSKNTIRENSETSFYLESDDMMTNDIGTDNLIDDKPIYYEKNISDKVYENLTEIGAFYCSNCQNIALKNISLPEKEAQVVFWHTNNSSIEGLSSNDKSTAIGLYYSSNNIIKRNSFKNIRVYKSSNENRIYNNNIMTDDSGYTISYGSIGNLFNENLPIGGNYWKSNESKCKDLNNDKICDAQFWFNGGHDDYSWVNEFEDGARPTCQEDCFSNVLFLPGIKASRLYKKDALGIEDKLWIPNFFGNDLKDLRLDENGNSIENVYTRDVLDEVAIPIVGGNIYKTFLGKMANLKADGTINDYETFAYDWRQNVEDIAKSGTPYPDGMIKSAVDEIIALADSSKSQKVTIIAHSNGGLVAKAAMLELEKQGLIDKVDKIVFVGTPQMGTPLALLSMLYGYDEAALFGTLISRSESRELAENMPGAYGLLPSAEYFERMENPFINFSSLQTRYSKFAGAYGENIDNFDEFKNFLLGKIDGRTKPETEEVEKENILNEKLLNQASEMHQRLDAWTPPANIEVIQIAGWGLDTVSGVEYLEKEKTDCFAVDLKVPSCIGIGEYEPAYEPKFTVDGDKVVVAPSALMLSESENVKRYWVDLWSQNKGININHEHKNILEVDPIQQFVENIIVNNYLNITLPKNIQLNRPNPEGYNNAKPRLRMSLYSPLDIHLYDEENNHTGPKIVDVDGEERTVFEEGIPNSYYQQFGDRKYVGFEGGENIRVVMDGYATGVYTLKLEELKVTEKSEEVVAHTVFENLPTTSDTTVSFAIPMTGLVEMTTLKADIDSDGTNDYEVDKVLNGTAVAPMTIEMISDNVTHLAKLGFIADAKTQDFLLVKIRELLHDKDMIEKMESKDNKNPKANQIKLLNKKIDDLIGFIQDEFGDTILPLAKNTLIQNLNSVKM